MKNQEEKTSQSGASLLAGFKYDSHLVQTLESVDTEVERDDTTAIYAGFSTFWQRKFSKNVGLRADYNIYGDSHSDYKENNIVDQLASIEPQLSFGDFIFSLPLQYTYAREDSQKNYHRYGVVPTVTWSFPDSKQAVEFYSLFSRIKDIDQFPSFDEDSRSWGGGLSYLKSLTKKDRSYFRIQADYSRSAFDSRAWDYLGEIDPDKRFDLSTSVGADLNLQVNRLFDFIIRYTFIHTHSNVRLYDYDKHLLQMGWSFKLF